MAEVTIHPLHHADHVVRVKMGRFHPRYGLYRMQINIFPCESILRWRMIMKFNCQHLFDSRSASLVDDFQ